MGKTPRSSTRIYVSGAARFSWAWARARSLTALSHPNVWLLFTVRGLSARVDQRREGKSRLMRRRTMAYGSFKGSEHVGCSETGKELASPIGGPERRVRVNTLLGALNPNQGTEAVKFCGTSVNGYLLAHHLRAPSAPLRFDTRMSQH